MLTRCRPLLGTFVEIIVPRDAGQCFDAAFQEVVHVHERMSFHDEDSDLARLRRAATDTTVEVAPETVEVLSLAQELHRRSDGLFDVTIGHELVRSGFLPRPPMFPRSRRDGSTADIDIIDDGHVICHKPMLIDLGGIAKGYAVDRAIESLQRAGVSEALVNAGGDLRMFGDRDWEIQLRDADEIVRLSTRLANCAMASSANLANRRRRMGRLHTPHIGLNRNPIACDKRVSVIAPRCVIADAMTKIAMADRTLAQRLLADYGGRVFDDIAQESEE